ncbi:hypothetical protein P9112_002669 [Eukaryota sp. TZLM1-RC]
MSTTPARRKLFSQFIPNSPNEYHPSSGTTPPPGVHPPPGVTKPQKPISGPSSAPRKPPNVSVPPYQPSPRLNTSSPSKYHSPQPPTPHRHAPSPYVPKSSQADRHGLLGLVSLMKADNADLTQLALGTDLMQLGLNLNSTEVLYSKFDSPFDVHHKSDLVDDLRFELPPCYYSKSPTLKVKHFYNFTEDTLFYVFYSFPRDVLQNLASDELVRRGWMYHKMRQVWLKPHEGKEHTYLVFDHDLWKLVTKSEEIDHSECFKDLLCN